MLSQQRRYLIGPKSLVKLRKILTKEYGINLFSAFRAKDK